MKRKQITWITIAVAGILFSAGMFFGEGLMSHFNKYSNPGPLSAAQAAEPKAVIPIQMGAVSSHADFEQECGHCHAPLHCVTDTQCQDCHLEIAEQRLTATGLHSAFPDVGQCEQCHKEHLGREASITQFAYQNIDHQLLSGFSLADHQWDYDQNAMNCESCHSQNQFSKASLDCVSCHVAEGHDRIAEHMDEFGSDCVPCHDGTDRMANFEHDHFYALDGEHQNTDCAECHAGKVFAGTSTECVGCHEDPEIHLGIFGIQCQRCHIASAWMPAQLTVHTFLVDHGEDASVSSLTCETCHENTYTEYPCYSCHDNQEMVDYHDEIDIDADENCIDCHPTGREGEADQYIAVDSGM